MSYYKYSDYLKNEYGEKVYKIPINLPLTCPNRDGNLGSGGCIYCGSEGTGFESLDNSVPIERQMELTIEHVRKKYAADKYIAYFQNFSNTYMKLNRFEEYIRRAIRPDVVEIAISTRPDCIRTEYLEILKQIEKAENIRITIELGLQTANYHTLEKIGRGHTLAEFIDSVRMIQKYCFKICTHVILNLPFDSIYDIIETAKILSALRIDFVKIHSLYIVKGTVLEEMYKNKEFEIGSLKEYKDRVKLFLRYLDEGIAVERVISRAPKANVSFMNWHTSWWKIRDELEEEMQNEKIKQGDLCSYLNGKALKEEFLS